MNYATAPYNPPDPNIICFIVIISIINLLYLCRGESKDELSDSSEDEQQEEKKRTPSRFDRYIGR